MSEAALIFLQRPLQSRSSCLEFEDLKIADLIHLRPEIIPPLYFRSCTAS